MVTSSVSQGAESKEQRAPRVFISYSWDSDEHKVWVRELAARLRANRVDVILDCWHLRLGMDAARFMTESVSKNDFVLVICTPEYVEKSYRPKGGVRFENVTIQSQHMPSASRPARAAARAILPASSPEICVGLFSSQGLFIWGGGTDDQY
jgi:TIR domain